MPTLTYLREPGTDTERDEIAAYCKEILALLPRSDQRRWGEVYLRGLLETPGRKSPGAISERVLGRRAVQPLQQFINQSTWPVEELRARLAARFCSAVRPQAWAVEEVVFPKCGTRSVGVGRQFVHSEGKVMNCQLALAVSLVHDRGSIPIDWHLLLPSHWDQDEELRRRAHLPHHARHRPRWHHVLDSVDRLLADWDVPAAPLLADWRGEPDAEPLLRGLEERRRGYLVELGSGTPLPGGPVPGRRGSELRRVGEVVQAFATRMERVVVAWQDRPRTQPRPSQFMVLPLSGRPGAPRRQLVVEWPFGRPEPRTYWITNLPADRLSDTIALAELRHHSSGGCHRLHREFGLGDFEGRSYRGWHHHVTLASAALGFHALRDLEQAAAAEAVEPVPMRRARM